MLAALGAVGMAQVERTAVIMNGQTMISRPMSFTTADTITTSDTTNITIHNPQAYMQHQVFTYTLDSISGDPSITVIAYGKVSSGGSWVQIGSTATWDDVADNPQTISSTAPINYNYLKVEFAADGTTQKSQILTFDARTANAMEVPTNAGTLTITRATSGTVTITSADDDANAALTVGAGGTGALTLGDATSTTAITSTDWAINATGVASGLGNISSNGSLILSGSVSGGITLTPLATGTAVTTIQNQNVSAATITLPSATSTLPGLGLGNAWTGANTFPGGTSTVPLVIGVKSNTASEGHVLVGSTDNTGGVQIFCDDGNTAVSDVTSPLWTRYLLTSAQSSGATQTGLFAQLKTKDASTTFTGGSITALKAYNQAGVVVLASGAEFGIINAGTTLAGEMTVPSGTYFTGVDINLGGVGPVTATGTGLGAGLRIRNKGEGATWPVDISMQYGETIANTTDGTVAVSGVLSANLRVATVVVNTDESETLTAAQSGAIVTFDGAGTATIPDASAATIGVVYYLLQTADNELIVTSTTANNNSFVCDNVATSDLVTYGGVGHLIGGGMIVKGISATKWFVGSLNGEGTLTPEAAD
ncbi:hypothetical protein D4R42_00820 [bacterium]|nr:MAG: hypothetical protein D4R42_00820 [bacterium]